MRDAVDDEVVLLRRVVAHAAQLDELGDHVAAPALVNALDQGDREGSFTADQESNFFHRFGCPFKQSGVWSL